jgi:transcriptional regulator GlxA family with amidase domain
MNLRRLLNLALAVFVTVGLAVTPLVAPAAAAQNRAGDMTAMSMSSDISMSSDMTCCPDQKSMDCQDCPLIAMCVLQTLQAGPPMAAALLLRYAVRTAHIVRDDALSAGLDRPPPDQPPRSQV